MTRDELITEVTEVIKSQTLDNSSGELPEDVLSATAYAVQGRFEDAIADIEEPPDGD
jgi:hypothetical protein